MDDRDATQTIGPPLPLWGLLAEYRDAPALRAAAAKVRDAGYRHWDCHAPFPVHGLDQAMGIRPTMLPWLVLGAALTGCLVALGMQWYVNSPHTVSGAAGALSGYPLVYSGKPYWSLPAHIPVAFELTVLFASLAAFFGLWALIRLPRFHHPVFGSGRFRRATDDGFFLVIEARDARFDLAQTKQLLTSTASVAVEEVWD
ncbi:MAG: DUF3341 domain-containing protein [Candidatus Anammoximicrobium sp.]|nr:DUF3341 domain-containing protein [Candidatus Anammoximicrobium sp.]